MTTRSRRSSPGSRADGINKNNTLFVFTVDEGDHFVGGTPTPASCDGVTVPCDWTTNNQVGEINANIDTLVSQQFPALAAQFLGAAAPNAFTVHGDDAPTFYLAKKGAGGGQLAQTDPLTRDFERQVADLTAVNPYTGVTDRLMVAMADQAEMKLLHMYTTGDPTGTPRSRYFADPNYFLTDFPTTTCLTCINPAFAWNHGDIQPEIATTWLGFVGPGVRHLGRTQRHLDRPHGRAADDAGPPRPPRHVSDRRPGDRRDLPHPTRDRRRSIATSRRSSRWGPSTSSSTRRSGSCRRRASGFATHAAASGSATDDSAFNAAETKIADWTTRRDALAARIGAMIAAADGGQHDLNVGRAQQLIAAGVEAHRRGGRLVRLDTPQARGPEGGSAALRPCPPPFADR